MNNMSSRAARLRALCTPARMRNLRVLALAVLLALLLRTMVVSPCMVSSGSMQPTLLPGDWTLVNRVAYGLTPPFLQTPLILWAVPKPGDVVLFRSGGGGTFVKRVVALPGDMVEMREKRLYVNGRLQDEPYAVHQDSELKPVRDDLRPVTVPPGKLFVLGDNRDRSSDSRFRGFVDVRDVAGQVVMVYWSRGARGMRWDRFFVRP